MKNQTYCAFHPKCPVLYFCKCSPCLLPLCQECISLHKKQHKDISESIQIAPLEGVVLETQEQIRKQSIKIDRFYNQTIKQFQQSQHQHKLLTDEIAKHRNALIEGINEFFQSIYMELNSNSKRREEWLKEFHRSVTELKQEYESLMRTLHSDKVLRTLIMWNKIKPYEEMNSMVQNIERQWPSPKFNQLSAQKLHSLLKREIKLQILEIEGDSGLQKIIRVVKNLRNGEQLGIMKKQGRKKLSLVTNPHN